MGSVLIDNWNLSNANIEETYNNGLPNKAYSDLLSALVLWDEVYYLDDGLATFGWLRLPKGERLKSILKPLYLENTIKKQFERSADLLYEQEFAHKYKKIVAERALFYHEMSKAFGVDYYPIQERAVFLDEAINNLELWSRNDILDIEEKEVLKRIQELNNGKELFIKMPILTKLIVKNSDGDYLSTALDIRATREVKSFRKYMDKIDQEINNGNYGEVRHILRIIPDIIDDIEKMDRPAVISTNIKIKLTPMILTVMTSTILSNIYPENELLNWGLACLGLKEAFKESKIEISKEWNVKMYPKKIQLNFLRTLAKAYFS